MFKNKDKKILVRQLIGVMAGVTFMGFAISWLVPCGFGVDGFTALNLAISKKIGLSFGTWQAVLNCILFLIVIIGGRQYIGLGTMANMLLVGYTCDFFSWIRNMILPPDFFEALWVRCAIAVPALLVFVVAAAIYMDMGLGMAPYDALPFILQKNIKRVPFRAVRISFDLGVIVIGYLFGAPFAIVTLAMAFLLGPAVEMVGKMIEPFLIPSCGKEK